VASVSDLQKVYSKAGQQIAATFTNSLIQKFPFDGPIEWKLIFFKDPMVFLYGKVATNALHSFIISHPGTRFLWVAQAMKLKRDGRAVRNTPQQRGQT
jgi:hypothetical protein